jgi:hypothetical protein
MSLLEQLFKAVPFVQYLEDYGWPLVITGTACYVAFQIVYRDRNPVLVAEHSSDGGNNESRAISRGISASSASNNSNIRSSNSSSSIMQDFNGLPSQSPTSRPSLSLLLQRDISSKFGDSLRIFQGSLSDALTASVSAKKLFFLYLHPSTKTENLDAVENILMYPFTLDILNENFVIYCGVGDTPETRSICNDLRINFDTGAPFLSVMSATIKPQSNPSAPRVVTLKLLTRIQEVDIQPDALIGLLIAAIETQQEAIDQQEQLDRTLETNRSILQSQNAEYERALQSDLQLQREAEETKAREAEAEAKRLSDIEEMAKKELAIKQLLEVKAKQVQEKINLLGAEPKATDANVKLICLRLPNGDRVKRHFLADSTLSLVVLWAETLEMKSIHGSTIEMNACRVMDPVQKIPLTDTNVSIGDIVGKSKQGLLLIEEL